MTTIQLFLLITMMLLVLGIIASFVRMIKGPRLWDRILMLNLISAKVVLIIFMRFIWIV